MYYTFNYKGLTLTSPLDSQESADRKIKAGFSVFILEPDMFCYLVNTEFKHLDVGDSYWHDSWVITEINPIDKIVWVKRRKDW